MKLLPKNWSGWSVISQIRPSSANYAFLLHIAIVEACSYIICQRDYTDTYCLLSCWIVPNTETVCGYHIRTCTCSTKFSGFLADSSRTTKIKLAKCFPQKCFAHQIFRQLCVSRLEVAVESYLEIYTSAFIGSSGFALKKRCRRPPSRLMER